MCNVRWRWLESISTVGGGDERCDVMTPPRTVAERANVNRALVNITAHGCLKNCHSQRMDTKEDNAIARAMCLFAVSRETSVCF